MSTYANSWIKIAARQNIIWIRFGNRRAVRRRQTEAGMALTAIGKIAQWGGVAGCSGSRTLLFENIIVRIFFFESFTNQNMREKVKICFRLLTDARSFLLRNFGVPLCPSGSSWWSCCSWRTTLVSWLSQTGSWAGNIFCTGSPRFPPYGATQGKDNVFF